MNKKGMNCFQQVLLVVSLFVCLVTMVNADAALSTPSVCCEKTDEGAWCINTDESSCNDNFKVAPTSCETTSYCRLGTCYNSESGICMESTPQRVCDDSGGTWDSREIEQIPQCQLGCCIIADQAAFVSLVRCKRLSTLFGIENNYRTDITSEVNCVAMAQAQDVGACVYEKDFERICKFTTRDDCGAGNEVEAVAGNASEGVIEISSQKKFYKDYLCSAEELNTACAKQTLTMCYQGKVYWVDSCGNRENVYSTNKDISWNNGRVAEAVEICAGNDGSNKNCGNCEYLLGSRCAKWEGFLGVGKPEGSDYYCQKTECVDREGNKRMNGESWCVYDDVVGKGADRVGSRYYRELCVDGEVRVEACADFRNEICLENSIETSAGDFGTAACRVNRWQTCTTIDNEDDCTNPDRVDCMWLSSVTGMILGGGQGGEGTSFSNPSSEEPMFSNPTATGNVIATGHSFFGGSDEEVEEEETITNRPDGICVPNFSPGLEFWEVGSAKQICGIANAKCLVRYEKTLLGSEKCVENCECLEEGWALDANRVCSSLGDCGGYVNYKGVYTDDGYKWNLDGSDKEFSPNNVNIISGGFSGRVIAAISGEEN